VLRLKPSDSAQLPFFKDSNQLYGVNTQGFNASHLDAKRVRLYAGLTSEQVDMQSRCREGFGHNDLKRPTENLISLHEPLPQSPLNEMLQCSDWQGVVELITEGLTNATQQRDALLTTLNHPNFFSVIQDPCTFDELTEPENRLFYLMMDHSDQRVLEAFYQQLEGDHYDACQRVIANEQAKAPRDRLAAQTLSQKISVLSNPFLLDQLMQLPEARKVIAGQKLDNQSFWDKFTRSLCQSIRPNAKQNFCRRSGYHWTMSQIEKNDLTLRLARNSSVTSYTALSSLLEEYKYPSQWTKNELGNTNLALYKAVASTPRDWEAEDLKPSVAKLSEKIVDWTCSNRGPKFGSPEYFDLINSFLKNEGLPSFKSVTSILRHFGNQGSIWSLPSMLSVAETMSSMSLKMNEDEAFALYRNLPKLPKILKNISGNLSFPDAIIRDAINTYEAQIKSRNPLAKMVRKALDKH